MEKSPQKPKWPKKPLENYARFMSVGMQMLFTILLAVFSGVALDRFLNLKFPIFTLLFSLGGVILAIFIIIHKVSDKRDS
jgi:F0F1-type ATP synthase assembly protein I